MESIIYFFMDKLNFHQVSVKDLKTLTLFNRRQRVILNIYSTKIYILPLEGIKISAEKNVSIFSGFLNTGCSSSSMTRFASW